MKTDDVIDDVARRMTETAGRPDLRMRVMAGIDDDARSVRQLEGRTFLRMEGRTFRFGQLVPALAGGAVACATLVWMLLPAPAPESPAPVATTARAVTPAAPETTREAAPAIEAPAMTIATARASTSRPVARPAATEASTAPTTWTDAAEEWMVPTLPPLEGPPAIEIAPIVWDEVTIAPLTIAAIEVKALEIEPLEARGLGGV